MYLGTNVLWEWDKIWMAWQMKDIMTGNLNKKTKINNAKRLLVNISVKNRLCGASFVFVKITV